MLLDVSSRMMSRRAWRGVAVVDALQCGLQGGGTENMSRYTSCRLEYLDIDNIHVVREAFVSLRAGILEEHAKSLHVGEVSRVAVSERRVQDVLVCGCGLAIVCHSRCRVAMRSTQSVAVALT